MENLWDKEGGFFPQQEPLNSNSNYQAYINNAYDAP
jgi:hypothetical protein